MSSLSGQPDYHSPVSGPGVVPGAYERRITIFNDSEIVDGTAPPSNRTEVTDRGKFFPRGCRGKIEQLQIYCKRTGSGTIVLSLSPHPILGVFQTVTITPGSSWAWKSGDLEKFWSYDSLFIWVSTCAADVSWAYDAVKPYDGHVTADSGASFSDSDTRPFIRAVFTGQTLGDVPISGIVNNIQLPGGSSYSEKVEEAVGANDETTIVTITGAGYCDLIQFLVKAAGGSENTVCGVYCDSVKAMWVGMSFLGEYGFTAASYPIGLQAYGANDLCLASIAKRFEFKRELKITAYHASGAQTVTAYVHPTLLN